MLKIDNLSYEYEDDGVYDFSMEVNRGEIVAILGESGSGKSTLLDLIAGFITPKSGHILFDGSDLLKLPIERRPISILFQNHNLFEHLSVEKNISLGLKESIKKDRVKEILKDVGLEGYEKRGVLKLSGGQQQRVALARVLLRDKEILLLDEPFSGLDEKSHLQMLDLVKMITDKKKLHTIMVTHDRRDCKLVADRVYEVKNRKLFKSDEF